MRSAPLLLIAAAFAAAPSLVPPRDSAAAYPAHSERRSIAIGAQLLSRDQVHGSFSSELDRAYLVVEVGVFPNEQIDLSLLNFTLIPAGSHTSLRPVQPKVAAAVLQKPGSDRKSGGPGDITLYPSVGVGYESGPGWDGRRRGGWTTSTGVGVGIGGQQGPPPPASTGADRSTMETELSEKGLPEGPTRRAVAGYLYFPYPGKKKEIHYDLQYTAHGEKLLLPLGRYTAK